MDTVAAFQIAAGLGGATITVIGGLVLARRASSHRVDRIDAETIIAEGRSIREFQLRQHEADQAEIARLAAENDRLHADRLRRERARHD